RPSAVAGALSALDWVELGNVLPPLASRVKILREFQVGMRSLARHWGWPIPALEIGYASSSPRQAPAVYVAWKTKLSVLMDVEFASTLDAEPRRSPMRFSASPMPAANSTESLALMYEPRELSAAWRRSSTFSGFSFALVACTGAGQKPPFAAVPVPCM